MANTTLTSLINGKGWTCNLPIQTDGYSVFGDIWDYKKLGGMKQQLSNTTTNDNNVFLCLEKTLKNCPIHVTFK